MLTKGHKIGFHKYAAVSLEPLTRRIEPEAMLLWSIQPDDRMVQSGLEGRYLAPLANLRLRVTARQQAISMTGKGR